MWFGLKVSSYLLDNKDVAKVLSELKKKFYVTEKEEEGQTSVIVKGRGYFFIKKLKNQALVSLPYHSIFTLNSGLLFVLLLFLLADVTLVLGLAVLILALLYGYWRYQRYATARVEVTNVIEKYSKQS